MPPLITAFERSPDRGLIRLADLSRHLGDADWLDGAFSAGDLLMVTVLRRLETSGLLEAWPPPPPRPMWRAARRGRPIGGRSQRSGRCSRFGKRRRGEGAVGRTRPP